MIPVFGPGVVYDSPHEKMASQLSFVKHGLSKAIFAAPVSSYNRCGCLTDGVARQDMMAKHPQRLQREIVEFLGSHSETYDAAAGRIKDQGTL